MTGIPVLPWPKEKPQCTIYLWGQTIPEKKGYHPRKTEHGRWSDFPKVTQWGSDNQKEDSGFLNSSLVPNSPGSCFFQFSHLPIFLSLHLRASVSYISILQCILHLCGLWGGPAQAAGKMAWEMMCAGRKKWNLSRHHSLYLSGLSRQLDSQGPFQKQSIYYLYNQMQWKRYHDFLEY